MQQQHRSTQSDQQVRHDNEAFMIFSSSQATPNQLQQQQDPQRQEEQVTSLY